MTPNNTDETFSSNPEIADDLLTCIFLLLPIKSLIRFQSVSKHWQSLIADPQFHNLRIKSNLNPPSPPATGLIFPIPNNARGLARTYAYIVPLHKSLPFRKLNFTHTSASPWDIKVMSSCNGLLLIAVKEFYYTAWPWDYYICNPTTNKYAKLPKIDEKYSMSKTRDCMSLAFDPTKSPHYKVVRVHQLRDAHKYKIIVYSSETGAWEKRGEPFAAIVDFEKGVYWNGAYHWIGGYDDVESIYFNPDDDQTPRVMPTPPNFCWGYSYFGESCDRMQYVTINSVYEMKRDYSGWFAKYCVDLPRPMVASDSSICSLVRGNDDKDTFLVLCSWGRIVRFNLADKTIEVVHEFKRTDFGGYNLVCGGRAMFPLHYIDSLCSV